MKERLDVLLVKKGLFDSRSAAASSIMAGLISVDGQMEDKAGKKVDEESQISIKEDLCPYVSRGGLKIQGGAEEFGLDFTDKITMDIGASTGGFTDFMLKNGAAKVYAIDVGYGQLDWKLRNDERVVNLERTNIRYLNDDQVGEKVDFITIDVAFISLKLVLPVAAKYLKEGGQVLALIKPQFEAGREQVGKKGIVRDQKVRDEVIENVKGYARENGLTVKGLVESPIQGAKGNVEYLIWLEN